jgi:predicted phosphoadenosine phosphosulfate sulfurtransferase
MWKIKLYLIQRRKMLKRELKNYFTDVNADYEDAKEFITILMDNCNDYFKDFMNILHSELFNIKIN